MNLTPKELTPCKISHICRCAFNDLGANNWDESKVEEAMLRKPCLFFVQTE